MPSWRLGFRSERVVRPAGHSRPFKRPLTGHQRATKLLIDYFVGAELAQLERAHLVRLGVWALGSLFVGAVMMLWARRSALGAFWQHAGIQCVAWALVDLAIVVLAWRTIEPRDIAGAVALDRVLWLNIGLDAGYAMVGGTLIAFGARRPRRLGLIGAGAAIVVQGIALAALDAYLSAAIVR